MDRLLLQNLNYWLLVAAWRKLRSDQSVLNIASSTAATTIGKTVKSLTVNQQLNVFVPVKMHRLISANVHVTLTSHYVCFLMKFLHTPISTILSLLVGYVCTQCQQNLSEEYGIRAQVNEHSVWEIQRSEIEKKGFHAEVENQQIQVSSSNKQTNRQSILEPSASSDVQTINDDAERSKYQGPKHFPIDPAENKSDTYLRLQNSKPVSDNYEEQAKYPSHTTSKHHNLNVSNPNSCYPTEMKDNSRLTDYHSSSEQLRPSVTLPGRQGLNNLGNTCFMNSALQCLLHIPELKSLFLSSNWANSLNRTNSLGSRGKVAEAFARLTQSMWSPSSNGIVSPKDFKVSIAKFNRTFTGYDQQDPFELLNTVLDALHEDLKCDERHDSSPISNLFHGDTVSIVKCINCTRVHHPDPELFSSLSLNIPTKPPFTLQQCFIEMSAIQYQTDDSEWYCSYCKSFSKSTTETFLQKLPPILIVHFKRFDYDPKSYVHIDTFIEYPFKLEIDTVYAPKSTQTKYELIAVCLKEGSLRGGHAYAYAKLEDGEWYCFNDSSVRPIHANDVISRHAYILTYRRLDNVDAKYDLHRSHNQNTVRNHMHHN